MGVGRFLGGGNVQQNSNKLRMNPSKDRGTHLNKGQGEGALVPVPLCFSEVVRKRQGREEEADDDQWPHHTRYPRGIAGSH